MRSFLFLSLSLSGVVCIYVVHVYRSGCRFAVIKSESKTKIGLRVVNGVTCTFSMADVRWIGHDVFSCVSTFVSVHAIGMMKEQQQRVRLMERKRKHGSSQYIDRWFHCGM